MDSLRCAFRYTKQSETDDLLRNIKERLEAEISKKMWEKILPDQWYRIRLSFCNMPDYMNFVTYSDLDVMVMQARLNIDVIPERAVVYRSPESQFLPPVKSFRQKLKNCVKYLRDKTGGSMETVSINGNEVNKNDRTQ